MTNGKAIILSAPSGSGKTTIVKHLMQHRNDIDFSVSATTRERRSENEHDGKDYYFLTVEAFQKKIEEGAFIEWEQVYENVYYGTLKSEVERIWAISSHVIFDVDVLGGLNLKQYFDKNAIAIFIKVQNREVLKQRLIERKTETEDLIEKRLLKADYEMSFEKSFDVSILNDNLETSCHRAAEIVDVFLDGKG